MANKDADIDNNSDIPPWINASLLEPVLKQMFTNYQQINDFLVENVTRGGHSLAKVLRLQAKVELQGELNIFNFKIFINDFISILVFQIKQMVLSKQFH